MLLVRPKVSHIGWFSFSHVDELLQIGYDAMRDALQHLDQMLQAPGGIFPKRQVDIVVDRAACTGCALCVARAPGVMALDAGQKAYADHRAPRMVPGRRRLRALPAPKTPSRCARWRAAHRTSRPPTCGGTPRRRRYFPKPRRYRVSACK